MQFKFLLYVSDYISRQIENSDSIHGLKIFNFRHWNRKIERQLEKSKNRGVREIEKPDDRPATPGRGTSRTRARGHPLRAPKIESDIIRTGISRVEPGDKHMYSCAVSSHTRKVPAHRSQLSRPIDAPTDAHGACDSSSTFSYFFLSIHRKN